MTAETARRALVRAFSCIWFDIVSIQVGATQAETGAEVIDVPPIDRSAVVATSPPRPSTAGTRAVRGTLNRRRRDSSCEQRRDGRRRRAAKTRILTTSPPARAHAALGCPAEYAAVRSISSSVLTASPDRPAWRWGPKRAPGVATTAYLERGLITRPRTRRARRRSA